MSKKPKTVKAWGALYDGQLIGFHYPSRKQARWMKAELERINETKLPLVVVPIQIRILPTPGNKRSA